MQWFLPAKPHQVGCSFLAQEVRLYAFRLRQQSPNVIESLNYSLKKPLKTKGAFPTEDALLKVLYLAIGRAAEKWTMPIHDWRKALNWFAQLFGARLLDRLDTQNR